MRLVLVTGLLLVGGLLLLGCSSRKTVGDGSASGDLLPGRDLGPWLLDHAFRYEASADQASSSVTIIDPLLVEGSSCANDWQSTGKGLPDGDCQAYIQSIVLGVGSGAEPDRYGCSASASTEVEAYLYETGCDDKSKIALECSGSCDGQGVARGSVVVMGKSDCRDGWRPAGLNLGPGKSCQAFLGSLTLGVGSGPEPETLGCRYNAQTGDIEAYLYELGCDDSIALRCDWICGKGLAVGTATMEGATTCSTSWQPVGSSLGSGRRCVAGIGQVRLGIGSGAEPDRFGCRYDPATGLLEAQLYELGCDDKSLIRLECAYVCFD